MTPIRISAIVVAAYALRLRRHGGDDLFHPAAITSPSSGRCRIFPAAANETTPQDSGRAAK